MSRFENVAVSGAVVIGLLSGCGEVGASPNQGRPAAEASQSPDSPSPSPSFQIKSPSSPAAKTSPTAETAPKSLGPLEGGTPEWSNFLVSVGALVAKRGRGFTPRSEEITKGHEVAAIGALDSGLSDGREGRANEPWSCSLFPGYRVASLGKAAGREVHIVTRGDLDDGSGCPTNTLYIEQPPQQNPAGN